MENVKILTKVKTSATINIRGIEPSLKSHTDNKDNPHEVTAEQLGLGNVDNTSDLDKPISKATQIVLNEMQSKLTAIENILKSDDINLDELQELVNELKTNGASIQNIFNELSQLGNRVEMLEIPNNAVYGEDTNGNILQVFYEDTSGNSEVALFEETTITDIQQKLEEHTNNKDNPHSVTKEQLGLGNVLNVESYSKVETDELIQTLLDRLLTLENKVTVLEELHATPANAVYGMDILCSTF